MNATKIYKKVIQKPHELKVIMIIVSESDADNMHNSAKHELSAIPTPGSFILVRFSTRVSLGQVKSTEGNDFEVTSLHAKDDEHKIFSFPTVRTVPGLKGKKSCLLLIIG